jgi:maltose/moltooligosaccharide transporter
MNKDAVGDNHIPQVTMTAFLIGAVFSFTTVWWSVRSVPELPLSESEKAALRARPTGVGGHAGRDRAGHPRHAADDAAAVVDEAVPVVRDDVLLDLHRPYAGPLDVRHIRPDLPGFRDAGLLNGQIGGFYNFVAFVAAFAMVPFTRRLGAKAVHAFCLCWPAAGMWAIPSITDKAWLFVPMIGVGLAWASIMGNPYVLLAGSIPPERAGVYMGIFNMFIVIPMLIQMVTLPLFYKSAARRPARHVIRWRARCCCAPRWRCSSSTPGRRARRDEEPGSTDHLCRPLRRRRAGRLAGAADRPAGGVFGGVHLLPFFHAIDGADAGFDPIDHTRVDPPGRLGRRETRWPSTWT